MSFVMNTGLVCGQQYDETPYTVVPVPVLYVIAPGKLD
jgi:hypothetical protein